MLPTIPRTLTLRRSLPLTAIFFCVTQVSAAVVKLAVSEDVSEHECRVHVTEDGGPERTEACGRRLETFGKRPVGWVETPTSVTPFLVDVSAGGEIHVRGLVPSGSVAFQSGRRLGVGERIRLVSLVSPSDGMRLQRLFVRDISSPEAKLRLPAGRAAAMLVDKRDRALGVSIFNVTAGRETIVWPEAVPARRSVVAAWLMHPKPIERQHDGITNIMAVDEAGEHPPRALVVGSNAVFALWDDLRGPVARLAVESPTLRLEADRIAVERQTVTTINETLSILPTLRVAVGSFPAELRSAVELLSLEIHRTNQEAEPIRELSVEPGSTYTLELMPAALLKVVLRIDHFVIEKQVDLTAGMDTLIEIPLVPITVSGTVYLGDSPVAARVRFLQGKDDPIESETDYVGSYEVLLWQPGRYIVETVLLDNAALPPWVEAVHVPDSRTFDVHIPVNRVSVRVFDAVEKTPLEKARITFHSHGTHESGSSSRVASVEATGALTELPPMRDGWVDISASAPGYESTGPVRVIVGGGPVPRIVDIPMTRRANADEIQIRLADTSPAAGAEIAALRDGQILWRGTADGAGRVGILKNWTGPLLVRHRNAASTIVLGLEPGDSVSLEFAAPPLAVRVVGRNNVKLQNPMGGRLSLWLAGGIRLSGPEAAFATWSSELPTADGLFFLKGLGRRPLRAFVTRNASPVEIESGLFDALATTIPYPWPAVANVPLVDP